MGGGTGTIENKKESGLISLLDLFFNPIGIRKQVKKANQRLKIPEKYARQNLNFGTTIDVLKYVGYGVVSWGAYNAVSSIFE